MNFKNNASITDGRPTKRNKIATQELPFVDVGCVGSTLLLFLSTKTLLKLTFCVAKSVKALILQRFGGEEGFWKHLIGLHWRPENVQFLLDTLELTPEDCYLRLVNRQKPSVRKSILPPKVDGVRPLQYGPQDYIVKVKVAGSTKIFKGEDMDDFFGRGGEYCKDFTSEDPLFVAKDINPEAEPSLCNQYSVAFTSEGPQLTLEKENVMMEQKPYLETPDSVEIEIIRVADQRILRFLMKGGELADYGNTTIVTDHYEAKQVDCISKAKAFPQDEDLIRTLTDGDVDEWHMMMIFEMNFLRQQSETEFGCHGFELRFVLWGPQCSSLVLRKLEVADHVTNLHFVESAMLAATEKESLV